LVQGVCPEIARDDDLQDRIKQLGRALGSIRDLDARLDLLSFVEMRLPSAGSALVAARQRQRQNRAVRSRKMIKRLEHLDVDHELDRLSVICAHARRRGSGVWRNQLCRLIDTRGAEFATALANATAVYFPNRTHQTRIALKKFRYAAEIAEATGWQVSDKAMRRLKKAQDALGDMHDRDVLLDELWGSQDGDLAPNPQLDTIVQFLQAEKSDQYRRFLERRPALIAAVHDVRGALRRSAAPAIAASAVAAVAALAGWQALRRRALAPAPARPSQTVRVLTVPPRRDADEAVAVMSS
jgi:CHAD domain-containing protein